MSQWWVFGSSEQQRLSKTNQVKKKILKQLGVIKKKVFHLSDWGVDDTFVSILLPQAPAHLHTHTREHKLSVPWNLLAIWKTSSLQFLQTLYAPSYWATSSPSRKTRSSRSSSSSIAWLRASRTVTLGGGRGGDQWSRSVVIAMFNCFYLYFIFHFILPANKNFLNRLPDPGNIKSDLESVLFIFHLIVLKLLPYF